MIYNRCSCVLLTELRLKCKNVAIQVKSVKKKKQTWWHSRKIGMMWTKRLWVHILGEDMLNNNYCINEHALCVSITNLANWQKSCEWISGSPIRTLMGLATITGCDVSFFFGERFFGTIRWSPDNWYTQKCSCNIPIKCV